MHIVSRSSLSALGAPLTYHRWGLTIMNLPAIGLSEEKLCLRCLSCDKPKVSIEKTNIEQAGFRISYAGKSSYPDNFSVSFLSTGEGATIEALQMWKEYCCAARTGGSVDPSYYKATMLCSDLSYDNKTVIKTYTCYGVFPEEVDFGDSYSESVEAQVCNVTFNMDWFE